MRTWGPLGLSGGTTLRLLVLVGQVGPAGFTGHPKSLQTRSRGSRCPRTREHAAAALISTLTSLPSSRTVVMSLITATIK